jgi:hypothetical protein
VFWWVTLDGWIGRRNEEPWRLSQDSQAVETAELKGLWQGGQCASRRDCARQGRRPRRPGRVTLDENEQAPRLPGT